MEVMRLITGRNTWEKKIPSRRSGLDAGAQPR